MNIKNIKNFSVQIRLEKVLAGLRFKVGKTELDKDFELRITKEIQEVYSSLNTLAVYRVEAKKDIEFLCQGSKNVEDLLSDCEKAVVFAVSIGENVDNKIKDCLKNEDILTAAIWDAIGSEAVENSANYLNDFLMKKFLLDDYLTTKRYSAGYGDWDLKENFKIFEFLELAEVGIKINDTGLLDPQKTITAVFGLKKRK